MVICAFYVYVASFVRGSQLLFRLCLLSQAVLLPSRCAIGEPYKLRKANRIEYAPYHMQYSPVSEVLANLGLCVYIADI